LRGIPVGLISPFTYIYLVYNHQNMKYVRTLLILIFFLAFQNSQAQVVMQSRIAKLGYSADFMPFQESGYSSIHLDIENSTKIHYLTNELGAGFMRNGSDLYYFKFDYKFYPISAIFKNFRYQGLYVSVGPGLYYEDLAEQKNTFGLGIFTTGGLQFLLNNRLSVAFELEMNMVGNLGTQTESTSGISNDAFHFTNSIKIGYVFNHPARRKR
jgi:hypothetical protein